MPKLIDVKEAMEYARIALADPILLFAVKSVLDNTPAVESKEMVQCKDCKHYILDYVDGCYCCIKLARYVKKDFGCLYGERKDNERKAD